MVVISRPLAIDRQQETGVHRAAVDQHGAGAAVAHVAHLLGAGQCEVVAYGVEQRLPRLEQQRMPGAVDVQRAADSRGIGRSISRRHDVLSFPLIQAPSKHELCRRAQRGLPAACVIRVEQNAVDTSVTVGRPRIPVRTTSNNQRSTLKCACQSRLDVGEKRRISCRGCAPHTWESVPVCGGRADTQATRCRWHHRASLGRRLPLPPVEAPASTQPGRVVPLRAVRVAAPLLARP